MATPSRDVGNEQFLSNFNTIADGFELYSPGSSAVRGLGTTKVRGARDRGAASNTGILTLRERDGILRWDLGPAVPSLMPAGARMRGAREAADAGMVLRREFTQLEPNEISKYLEVLDNQLNPPAGRGLRQWRDQQQQLTKPDPLPESGRFLLIIHGTFSKSEHLIGDLRSTQAGSELLHRAANYYDRVLTFDHPTLSVGPMINAIDLVSALGSTNADVDIVCHSRGGLVSRWWMEAFDRYPLRRKRAVLVACTLGGTSLAAPPRLKAGLNLLANYSKLLGTAAMAVPFAAVPAALLRVIGSVVGVTSKLPLLDAAVAMIPGASGQSRVGNSYELQRLNSKKLEKPPNYSYVRANFQSENPGWKIWKYVTEGKQRAADAAADLLVFPGDNDLVVDTVSMTELPDAPAPTEPPILDFGTTSEVHHTNYFLQKRTLDFIAKVLQVP